MDESVARILSHELSALGFLKKANLWYKRKHDVIQVIGLQKSNWGNQYYVNVAVWVDKIERKEFPKCQECHIQCRLDSLPDNPDCLLQALDEEDSWKMDTATRRDILKLALCNAEFIFFRELDSFENVKRYIISGRASKFAVTQSLKRCIQSLEP